ncbi:MAG: hypothetical protein NWE94_02195 [Candidatus Bathyarchaeota archaeon]|nr:hypothetical protein [Candidatus Bathyarchaeota archaeon]
MLKNMKIALAEERQEDAWFDLSLRQLRVGEVRFYKVDDLLTGKWLFKVCIDKENSKSMVKAIKCPAGILFSQLEGNTMLFQKSIISEDLFYDVISLTRVDSEGKVRREIAESIEEVPSVIRENFDVKPYEEATGKKLPTSYLVTLTKSDNEKDMIKLFLLQRAWTLPMEEKQKTLNLMALIRKLEKASVAEIRSVATEQFGIEKDALDSLLTDLEAKGKIKRLDEGYVKAA